RVLNIQRRELSVDDEIVVIERERSRNAIGIELEADGVSRCLLCIVFVRLAALEITHGDRPARHRTELWLGGSRVVVISFVGFDLRGSEWERMEDFVSGFGTVIAWEAQNGLTATRGLAHGTNMFGRE